MIRGPVRPARPTWRAQGRALRMRRRLTARALWEVLNVLMEAGWLAPPAPTDALWGLMPEGEP